MSITLMTTVEAAEYLRISTQILERRRSQRLPPAYVKLGGQVRYRISDLDDWIEESTAYVEETK